MKKILFLLYALPFCCFSQSSLIFSEYGEGSSFNKWIELYNPSDAAISLDDYRFNFCWNGCDSLDWEFSIPFDSGYVLMPGETYLISHFSADSVLLNYANQTSNLFSNGNDVCAIYQLSTNSIIDIIGVFSVAAPNDGWDIGSTTNGTKNYTLIRNEDVCIGNYGDWSVSDGSIVSQEWQVQQMDYFSDLMMHTNSCTFSANQVLQHSQTNKGQLIKRHNAIGQAIGQQNNTILIEQYQSGIIEKKIIIE
jgi:hypothetical protein